MEQGFKLREVLRDSSSYGAPFFAPQLVHSGRERDQVRHGLGEEWAGHVRGATRLRVSSLQDRVTGMAITPEREEGPSI